MLLRATFILLCVLVLAVCVVVAMGTYFKRKREKARREGGERRCFCGYILRGLDVPRCPECGRAVGFDKTFEELGIRPEELRKENRGSET